MLKSIAEYISTHTMQILGQIGTHKILVRGATSGVGVVFLRLVKAANPDVYVAGTSRNFKKAQKESRRCLTLSVITR